MTTDDERRDVARRLRNLDDERIAGKLALNGTWVFADVLDEALFGKRIFKIQKHGLCYITSKLADLIDPVQGGTCAECAEFDRASKITPCRAFHGHTEADVTACDDFKPMKCDRDALLKLADEIQMDGADSLDDDDWCKGLLYEYAARIRDALGVES